jgi:hypothetical protein
MKATRYYLFISLVFIFGAISYAQQDLNTLMRERGEYYFTLNVDNPAEIQTINGICSVDGTDGQMVVCYANQQEYEKLLQAGYQPKLQTPPSMREEAKMWQGGDRATYDWDSYLTYGQYVSMMQGFPSAALDDRTCTLLDLGTLSTPNHRKILGVRLNNGNPDGKPKFLYSSTMHGDEVTGMILMLRLIDEFCTSTNPRIVDILNNVDLFIFPLTNPDGTYYGGNNTVYGATRRNGNNIDLNRHFPDFDDGPHPDGQTYYQDEAQWMMDLAQQYLFTMGANYHGGSEVVNYPWDTYQPLHPDDAWWQLVSHEYADLAHAVNSDYMDGFTNGITNGYAWYTISGSRQDYMNYFAQCRELTLECSNQKTPAAAELPKFWNYNHNSMLTYIEECLNGVHGIVCDETTNDPIQGVTVTVQNHDALGSSVSTHAVGDFHRPIKGGTYTFEFSKEGYVSQSVEVTAVDGHRIDLDTIYLDPLFTQSVPLYAGWNWWSTNVDIDLAQLEAALGNNGANITSQSNSSVSYVNGQGWMGELSIITSSQMYKIQMLNGSSVTISGMPTNPTDCLITLNPGDNWIGYPFSQSMSLSEALAGANPVNGDKISSYYAYAQYYNGAWYGSLQSLEPGQGYVYKSNATETKTFYFPAR